MENDAPEYTVNPPDMLYGSYMSSYLSERQLEADVLPVTMHPLVFTLQEANKTEKQGPLREPDLLIILIGVSMAYIGPDGVKVVSLGCLKD